MSNPSNRLAKFRSYSYYHVLAMCDCSATADTLALSQELNVWDHATPETAVQDDRAQSKNLGKYAPKRLEGSGKYIILINGATDAAYTITEAKWTSATAANAVQGDRGTSIAIEGSLRVSEPKGIAFLDQVVQCSVALGVDASQVVFVLKTFFVGHAYDPARGDYQDHIVDVPPINFIAYDVTGSFTEQGGEYQIQFVAAGHGAARLPQYGKAVNAMSITAGDSLEATLRKLQDNINESYDLYFDCVYEQIQSTNGTEKEELLRSLRRVNYVIEVGPDYKASNGQVAYTVTNQPQQYKNTAGCSDTAQITFPASSSIESAINTIMLMSPQVQADMAKGDTASGAKYEYKIHTALESKPVDGANEDTLEYTVYYRVERFLVPKTIAYDPAFQALAQDDEQLKADPRYDQIRRNLIEFDYIYTGKNIDILEFDMKVNMGLAYLQTATLANTFKSQLERSANRQMQASTQDVNTQGVRFGGALVQTPVFFGSQVRVPNLINQQNAGNAIQSAYTLTKHASLEVAEASMRIIGNEQLLGSTNRTSSPANVIASASRSQTTNTPDSADFKDWTLVPAFVKVNIKMPRDNDDFNLFTGSSKTGNPNDAGATDYARDFWFDGYYYVYGIEHAFENGEFTQNLQMIGIPKKSAFDATKNNSSREVNITQDVGRCFDNQVGCGTAGSSSAAGGSTTAPHTAVPEMPPSGTTAPTNTADANTLNRSARDPANVRGWTNASPSVKAAIIEASNRYGVDIVIMAQFAAKESSFNPKAHPPGSASSATGLYQFLKATWNGLVKQGKVLGLNATDGVVNTPGKTPAANDPRYNAQLNAYAGAAFLRDNARAIGSTDAGDLYLAHFLGPETARKVIASCNSNGGNSKLSAVLGTQQAADIAAANPTIVNANTTCASLRAWAATSMARLLINQTQTAKQTAPVQSVVPPSQAAGDAARTAPATARTADKAVAAVQNCNTQSAKKDVNPCGPTAQTTNTTSKPTATTQ